MSVFTPFLLLQHLQQLFSLLRYNPSHTLGLPPLPQFRHQLINRFLYRNSFIFVGKILHICLNGLRYFQFFLRTFYKA